METTPGPQNSVVPAAQPEIHKIHLDDLPGFIERLIFDKKLETFTLKINTAVPSFSEAIIEVEVVH